LADLELVHTKRQVLQDQTALIIGVEGASVLVRFTDDLNRALTATPDGSVTLSRNSPLLLWAKRSNEQEKKKTTTFPTKLQPQSRLISTLSLTPAYSTR
jgi:hypothetical protein